MLLKTGKRIAVAVLVMCYCLGQMIFPVGANGALDELLTERQEASGLATAQEKIVKIEDFSDIKTEDWFYPYLEYLVSQKMINGKNENSFAPDNVFSYAECSAVIVRYLGLEQEAKKRMKDFAERYPEKRNYWYAGYFEVLATLGLFLDYALFEFDNGIITDIDREKANSPVVRYRFAESISKSFELDSDLKAKNVFSEMGGCGREFIMGGGYNNDILMQYESRISDYADIPEESRRDVLKAYYNGLFNGDISGNFYPHNNLTRAEMAKVLATVSDYSLRTRLVEEGYGQKVTEDMLHTDAFGVKTLDCDVWQELLSRESSNLSIDGGYITYRNTASAPEGYAIDVYLYERENDRFVLKSECTLKDSTGFTYWSNDARVMFVMRNVKEGSRPEGVLDVRIENGNILGYQPLVRIS